MKDSLATISVLSTLSGVDAQLQAHLGMGINVGVSEHQLTELFSLIETNIGKMEADILREVFKKVVAKSEKS